MINKINFDEEERDIVTKTAESTDLNYIQAEDDTLDPQEENDESN